MGHLADFFVLIGRRDEVHPALGELRAIRLARVDRTFNLRLSLDSTCALSISAHDLPTFSADQSRNNAEEENVAKDRHYDYERGKDDGRQKGNGIFSGWGESEAYRKGRAAGAEERVQQEKRDGEERMRQERRESEARERQYEEARDSERRAEADEQRRERRQVEIDARFDRRSAAIDRSIELEKELKEKEDKLLAELKAKRPADPEVAILELQILQRRKKWDEDWEEDFQRMIDEDEEDTASNK